MRYFNQTIQTLPLNKLRQQQNRNLRHKVAYLYEKVPFYTPKMDEIGVKPADINGVKDLHKLPFTKKTDLRDNYPFGLLAAPQTQINRIHCSSGTTGKPTVVAYTKKDLAIFSEVNARSLVAAGCLPRWKLQNAYGYGLFTGGLGVTAVNIYGLSEIIKQHAALTHLHQNIVKKIKDNIGLSMNVTLTHFGAIPRSEGGKLSRIVDLRKK